MADMRKKTANHRRGTTAQVLGGERLEPRAMLALQEFLVEGRICKMLPKENS